MLVDDFIKILGQYSLIKSNKIFEDLPDRFSSTYSVLFLILFASLITVRSYFLNPMACFISTTPSGQNFQEFVETYCWIHGTYSINKSQNGFPTTDEEWKKIESKIDYYQWVPFILAFQTLLFYLPRFVWDYLTFKSVGVNIEPYFQNLNCKLFFENEEIESLAKIIETVLTDFGRHDILDRKLFNLKKWFLVFQSPWISRYLSVKFLYLLNSFLQLMLAHKILGFSYSLSNFGSFVNQYIRHYDKFVDSVYFPRVAYCNIMTVQSVGMHHSYMAQCTLSVNMINEKIYVFLWVWTLFVLVLTALSIVWWILLLMRENFQKTFIRYLVKQYCQSLKCDNAHVHGDGDHECPPDHSKEEENINIFICNYLRGDGLFIFLMLKNNVNKALLQEIFREVWTSFSSLVEKRTGPVNFM